MRQYNFLQAILMSFYPKFLAHDVGQRWGVMTVLGYALFFIIPCYVLIFSILPIYMKKTYENPQTSYAMTMMVKGNALIAFKEYLSTLLEQPTATRKITISYPSVTQEPSSDNKPSTTKSISAIPSAKLFNADTKAPVKTTTVQIIHGLPLIFWYAFLPICILISFLYHVSAAILITFFGKIFSEEAKRIPPLTLFKLAIIAMTTRIITLTLAIVLFDKFLTMEIFSVLWLLFLPLTIYYWAFCVQNLLTPDKNNAFSAIHAIKKPM